MHNEKNNKKQINKRSAIMDLYLNTQYQNVLVSWWIHNGTALPQGNIYIFQFFIIYLLNELHLTVKN